MNTGSSAATKKNLTAETQRTRRFRPWERTLPSVPGMSNILHAGCVRSQGPAEFPLTEMGLFEQYIAMLNSHEKMLDRELKKGSAELLILALIEHRPRHGYEISQLIEERSGGALRFQVASLYPLLYRLEKRGWVQGRWVEKAGQRRRRYYRLTPEGRKVLAAQRRGWERFVAAINRIAAI